MRVSIVIPAYNNVEFIDQTLKSVLAQDYPDLEVVIADHSSTDATSEIIERHSSDPRLRILSPTPTGGGALANWNRVSQAATGDLIKLVCGDDLIAPDIVSQQVAALAAHPTAVLSATRRTIVDSAGQAIIASRGVPASITGLVPGKQVIRAAVRAGTNILGEPGCVMMRRADLEAAGWWDSTNPYVIDERTYANVLLRGDFVGIPQALASFRINSGQWSARLAGQQAEQVMGFHNDFAREHPDAVSAADARIGNLKARVNAYGRRVIFAYLDFKARRAAK